MYNTTIDLSFIWYKSYHITKTFYKKDLDLTQKLDKGFMMRKIATDVSKIVRELQSDKVFITCDSYPFRKDIFLDYKNRGEKEPGFVESQQEFIDIISDKGVNVLKIPRLEADDIMSLIHFKLIKERQIIVTGDEDLRQHLDLKTYCYNADSKKKTFFYAEDSQLTYKPKEGIDYFYQKVDPFYVLFLKIIKGCSTDNVPPLCPKGYRMTKVDQIFEEYLKIVGQRIIDEDTLFILCQKAFPLERERFQLQLRLVCLQPEYMPSGSVELFEKLFENKAIQIDWNMKGLLEGSEYIDENYERKQNEE